MVLLHKVFGVSYLRLHFPPSTIFIIAAYSSRVTGALLLLVSLLSSALPLGALGWQAHSLFLWPSSWALPLLLSSFLRLKSCVSPLVLPASPELRPQTLWRGRRWRQQAYRHCLLCSFSSASSMHASLSTFKGKDVWVSLES